MPKTTVKNENYTAEMVQEMVSRYTACGTNIAKSDHEARDSVVKELAEKFGKSVRSVRSKLVNEKVYIKVATESKVTGETPEKKEVLAQRMVDASGLKLSADSVAKMNKTDISTLLNYFNAQVIDEAYDYTVEADDEV